MIGFVVEKDFEYKGFQCCVILQSLGHRCGYVNVGNTALKNVNYDDIDGIYCHGGLTYSRDVLAGHEINPNDWWIGWDYAHCDDGKDYEAVFEKFADNEKVIESCKYMKDLEEQFPTGGYVYSEYEVEQECERVVEQIIKEVSK